MSSKTAAGRARPAAEEAGTKAPVPPEQGIGPSAAGAVAVPPYALPALHFGLALVFFTAASLGLLVVAGELAEGRFLMPRVVAVAHLFTLGWVTLSIMGALYQLLPVVVGTAVRWPTLGYATLLLYGPGLALFAGGLVAGATGWVVGGAAAFSTALLLFIANAGASLVRAPRRDMTWWAVAGALAFLLITVVLGVSLAGNLRWSWLGQRRLLALGVHMHVALGGWVLLLVAGVARRLLPMFLVSHGASERAGTAAAVLAAAGAGVLALLHHAPAALVVWPAAALLSSAAVAFVVQALLYLRHGRRPTLDAGLRLAAGGVVFLIVSVALGLWAVAAGFLPLRLLTAYGAAVVTGAFALFVAGHYYKIVPFLVWNRHFAPRVGGGRPLPKVADLYSGRLAGFAALLLIAGAAGLVLGILMGEPVLVRVAAGSYALGALTVSCQILNLYRLRP
jgi:hypothetical protein